MPFSAKVSIVPTNCSIGIPASLAATPDFFTAVVTDSTAAAPYLEPAAMTFA